MVTNNITIVFNGMITQKYSSNLHQAAPSMHSFPLRWSREKSLQGTWIILYWDFLLKLPDEFLIRMTRSGKIIRQGASYETPSGSLEYVGTRRKWECARAPHNWLAQAAGCTRPIYDLSTVQKTFGNACALSNIFSKLERWLKIQLGLILNDQVIRLPNYHM